jgi:hypothetical protein
MDRVGQKHDLCGRIAPMVPLQMSDKRRSRPNGGLPDYRRVDNEARAPIADSDASDEVLPSVEDYAADHNPAAVVRKRHVLPASAGRKRPNGGGA